MTSVGLTNAIFCPEHVLMCIQARAHDDRSVEARAGSDWLTRLHKGAEQTQRNGHIHSDAIKKVVVMLLLLLP
jgi:hypothetical protein